MTERHKAELHDQALPIILWVGTAAAGTILPWCSIDQFAGASAEFLRQVREGAVALPSDSEVQRQSRDSRTIEPGRSCGGIFHDM